MRKILLSIVLLACALASAQTFHYPALETPNVFTNTNDFLIGIQTGPTTFANLPVTPPSGTQIFCQDCLLPSNPCTFGGGGTIATYLGGHWNCNYGSNSTGTGGTVTSAGLAVPAFLSVAGSPITTAGTFTVTLVSQAQNLVFASPNGSSGIPVFRSVLPADFGSQAALSVLGNCTGSGANPTFCALTANMIPSTLNATTFSGVLTASANIVANGTLDTFIGVLCAQQLGNPTGAVQVVGCGSNTTIQIAMNALPSTGGQVFIPPGTYAQSDITINKNNTMLRGSGASTVITPSGGAGHFGVILGDASPSTVTTLTLRDLTIQCPGGSDLTAGVLIRKGVAVQNLVDSVKIRGCAEGVNVGETGFNAGFSAFGNTLNNLDIDLVGTEVGVHVYQADGTNIINSSIRNGTLDTGLAKGIWVEGNATRTSIHNNYIEFIPGGDIILDTANGIVQSTMIHDNYMETFGASGDLLTIGSGVFDTFFYNNYSNSNASPSATYDIQISDGAQNVSIHDVRLQNRNTANIHNLEASASAHIILENIDIASSTSPLIDSFTGVVNTTYTPGSNPVKTIFSNNASLALQIPNAGGYKKLLFEEPASGAAQVNWCIGFSCDQATNTLQVTPSTTNGGSTYTNSVMSCTPTTCNFPLLTVNGFTAGTTLNTGTAQYQAKKNISGCTTAASIGGVCASAINFNWTTSFADTNYSVTCTPSGAPTNLPGAPYISSKTNVGVNVNYFAITAAAASWATIDCVAVHD